MIHSGIMKKILWCPQHQITEDQRAELGPVIIEDLQTVDPKLFKSLSNTTLDSNLVDLADQLYKICQKYNVVVLPIGSPAFMFAFASQEAGGEPMMHPYHRRFQILFAYSERVSEDVPQSDGTVKKIAIFKHIKFITL